MPGRLDGSLPTDSDLGPGTSPSAPTQAVLRATLVHSGPECLVTNRRNPAGVV
jgi:hypothetical protein